MAIKLPGRQQPKLTSWKEAMADSDKPRPAGVMRRDMTDVGDRDEEETEVDPA